MNYLYEIIKIARINELLIQRNKEYQNRIKDFIIPLPEIDQTEFSRKNGKILYDNRELAGIAGLFLKLKKDKETKIIYSNDLGSSIRGIDAIAIKGNTYYICEAKGTTTNKLFVSKFLRKTKTKGRQMSWDWIWRSLVEFAEDSKNSKVFLELYNNVIRKSNIVRLVSISQLNNQGSRFSIVNTKFYFEERINHLKGISEFSNQKNLLLWLDELSLEDLDKDVLELLKKHLC